MGELTHKAARAAFGKAIDLTLKCGKRQRKWSFTAGRSDGKIYGE